VVFPLIRRSPDGRHHGGQIALPGGKLDQNEDIIQAALREAEEEVGIARSSVEILGVLQTEIIEVSKHIVYPVIGVISDVPNWQPQGSEVDHIIHLSLKRLLNPDFKIITEFYPEYFIGPYRIWGATGRILGQFENILRTL
jgi:8-oxo-dGTP pyrophosphatase MutT (NUDIX family)